MRFYRDEPAYRSENIIGVCNSSEQINSSDLTLHFNKNSPNHRSKHSINKSIVILGLEILIHYCIHRCIIISNLSIKCNPFHADILQSEVFINTQTHAHPCTMIFFSLYSFSLYQYHEPKPHNFQWVSCTKSNRQYNAQYYGLIPC